MDSSKYDSKSNKKDDSSNKSTFGSFGSTNNNGTKSNDRKVNFANPLVTKFIEEDPAHARDMLHSRVNYWR